jgi:hypothetical protein
LPEDLATLLAAAAIGLLWIRSRVGRDIDRDTIATGGVDRRGILLLTVIWGLFTVAFGRPAQSRLLTAAAAPRGIALARCRRHLVSRTGLALALPAVGSGEALVRAAHDFPPPRVQALAPDKPARRRIRVCHHHTGNVSVRSPAASRRSERLAQRAAGGCSAACRRTWMAPGSAGTGVGGGGAAGPSSGRYGAMADAERMLHRASTAGALPASLASLHTRFGTPARGVDVTAAATVLLIVASGGRIAWLAREYAVAIGDDAGVDCCSACPASWNPAGHAAISHADKSPLPWREVPLGLLIPAVIVANEHSRRCWRSATVRLLPQPP